METSEANRGPIITPTGFQAYDFCLNPYVGCGHGCSYCYVRFFIKDKNHAWGDFLRLRSHLEKKIPKQLQEGILDPKLERVIPVDGKRIVLGTMTDPYQPAEEEHYLTRRALELIAATKHKPRRVGIFTKSDLILRDLDVLRNLPDPTVHFTLSPYPKDVLAKLERDTPPLTARIEAIKKLKENKITVCANVAPMLPLISDEIAPQLIEILLQIGVRQFFADPMQMYKESTKEVDRVLADHPLWPKCKRTTEEAYDDWKAEMKQRCTAIVERYKPTGTYTIWCDHVNKIWVDMRTGADIDQKTYDL